MPARSRSTWWILILLSGLISARGATTDVALSQLSFASTVFSIEAGLPSNVAQALCQTRDGYIWVGTEGGLARFDGVRFRVFRAKEVPELGDNLIRCLFEDHDGSLWIGTQSGLTRYREGQFARIDGLNFPIATLAMDRGGTLWIGTVRGGLWCYRGGRLSQCSEGNILKANDSPFRLFVDSSDRVWVANNHGEPLWIEGGKLRLAPDPVSRVRQANRFWEGAGGTVWIGTDRALFRWRDGALTQFGKQSGIGVDPVTDLMLDRAGRLWVASRGLWVAENPEVDEFTQVPVPAVEFPRFLLQDREGTYWLGSSGDGLARLRPSSFQVIKHVGDFSLARSRSIAVEQDGSIWAAIGNENGRLIRIHPDGRASRLEVGTGLDGDITSLVLAQDGSLWMGSRGSLARWRAGQLDRFPEVQDARVLFQSQDGAIWIGPRGNGIVRYENGLFQHVPIPAEYATETVSAMADAGEGAVYAGFSSNGILRLDRTSVRVLSGLPSTEIRSIRIDSGGRMWVGFRRRGLAVLLEGRWRPLDSLSQAFGERVSAIEEDGHGNMWFGCVGGIFWGRTDDFLAIARGEPAEGRVHIGGGEGVSGWIVGTGNQPAATKAPNGTIWFASRDGLIGARPDDLSRNTVPPPVEIETVTVDGKTAAAPAELKLAADVRSLTIDYTALSFVQPSRVLFRYRLLGYDKDWVDAGTRRTAFYSRLEPGEYRFQVIACNEDGVWNELGASIAIVRLPEFYRTWWFYGLVVTSLSCFGLGLYYWRTSDLRRQVARQTEQIRLQLENEARLRAELERGARLESLGVLAGGIAHDFNNLLTVIIANLDLAVSDERVRAVAGAELAAAERGAKRATELTQQLLTFAKGGDPILRAVALPDLVREAAEFARHGTAVRCEVTVAQGLPAANVDPVQIGRVVHNLVLNATQAMPSGIIDIRLAAVDVVKGQLPPLSAGHYIRLSVQDHGPGIAPENLAKIFDPYFSTKPKNHGLGLATVHSIVKRHQGHVAVESVLGKGATFHIWLPAAKESPRIEVVPALAPVFRHGPVRVLFMDDEEVIRAVAGGIFRHLKYEVTLVADGAEAVQEYASAYQRGVRYDVVVLDLTVPGGMGGREALVQIQRTDPKVCAVVSSGYSNDPVLAHYSEYGFRAVVPKPYQVEDLARTIRSVISGSV